MDGGWLARGEPHLPAGAGWLSEGERRYADSKPFLKRRSEFLVARWTLKQAVVRVLGLPDDPATLAQIEARHGADGAPVLHVSGGRTSYDVSMTDRAGWAVCMLAPVGSAIGCDLELVEPRTAAFVSDYFTPAEQDMVASAVAAGVVDGHALLANLVWSAKESALKVLHTGLRSDTRSVEVVLADPAAPDGRWSPLTVTTRQGEEFDGWWRRTGAFVVTTCALVPQPPPCSLELPPALDDATPLHSWLAHPRQPSNVA